MHARLSATASWCRQQAHLVCLVLCRTELPLRLPRCCARLANLHSTTGSTAKHPSHTLLKAQWETPQNLHLEDGSIIVSSSNCSKAAGPNSLAQQAHSTSCRNTLCATTAHLFLRICLALLHKVRHHVPVLLLQEHRQPGPLGGARSGCVVCCYGCRHLALHLGPCLVQPRSLQSYSCIPVACSTHLRQAVRQGKGMDCGILISRNGGRVTQVSQLVRQAPPQTVRPHCCQTAGNTHKQQ